MTSASLHGGPYLSAAFLCEKILDEKDGVKSAIRIFDRVTRTVANPHPPEQMEPFDYQMTLFIRLKSGDARGSMPLRITLVKPSGESAAPLEQTIVFEGEEDRGVDIVIDMLIKLEMPGIYWFHIDLKDARLTQIPFRVVYIPQVRRIHGSSEVPPPV